MHECWTVQSGSKNTFLKIILGLINYINYIFFLLIYLFIHLAIYLLCMYLLCTCYAFILFFINLNYFTQTIYFIVFASNNCRFMNISNVNVYDFIKKVYMIEPCPRTIIWMGRYIRNLLYECTHRQICIYLCDHVWGKCNIKFCIISQQSKQIKIITNKLCFMNTLQ